MFPTIIRIKVFWALFDEEDEVIPKLVNQKKKSETI